MNKKTKLDLIKDFSKLWKFEEIEEDNISEDKQVGYMNEANTVMIIPKLYSIKKLIKNNFIEKENKIPSLNYKVHILSGSDDKIKVYSRMTGGTSEYTENAGKYTPEYLKIITHLCSKTKSSSVIIKFRKDYPLWIETDEMICIIAPRVAD